MLVKLKNWLLITAIPVLIATGKLAFKSVYKLGALALILFGLSFVGMLPPSPFRALNNFLVIGYGDSIAFLRYLPVFVPFTEMLMILNAWLMAIVIFYGLKVPLRMGKVIKS